MPLANKYTELKMSRGWGMPALLLIILLSGALSAPLAFNASAGAGSVFCVLASATIAAIIGRLTWGGFAIAVAAFVLVALGGFTGWGIASLTGSEGIGTYLLSIAVGAISPIVYFVGVSFFARR